MSSSQIVTDGTKELAPNQSKEAAPQIQRSHIASTKLSAETKTKEPSNKYLMYLLLKPKSHRTSSSTQSNMQYHVSPHMGGPLGQSLHLCGRTLGPKPPNSFVVLSIYKISLYIPWWTRGISWWTRNTFLGGQIITFLVDKEYIPL